MKKKIVFLPYDFDTAIGINNEGALAFSYNLEDIDQTEGGADVFNGQQSVLWKNMRAAFFDEIKAMYQDLRSTGKLSYEKVEQKFEEHQAKWPEAIFNEDAWFKYLAPLVEKGNASYLSMLQGSKAEQRKWWLYNRFRYIDSKYNAGDSLTDVITIRGYAKADITIEPYADVYASVKYGSYLVQERGARNQKTTLECPLDNVNDTEIYIYSASQLADVGDLSGLMVGYADFSKAVRLQNLKIGDADTEYSNGNLTELYLGNNELLRTLDVRNCPNLTQAVDLSGCTNIEHIYFDGTAITGLDLPNGGILKTLHLPGTVANLSLLNQTGLTDFSLPDLSNLSTYCVENCGSAIDTKAMLSSLPAGCRVRIIGFDWTVSNETQLTALKTLLDTMRGINENGGNEDAAQMLGTIHIGTVTGATLKLFKDKYPDITISYTNISSKCYFMNYDGSRVLYTATVTNGGNASYSGSTPTKPSSISEVYTFGGGWSLEIGGEVDRNALRNIVEDRYVYPVFTATVRTYTVKYYVGTRVIQTINDVPYGGSVYYNGATPTNTAESDPTDYEFTGWDILAENIQGNTNCYAQFKYVGTVYKHILDGALKGEYKNTTTKKIGYSGFGRMSAVTKAEFTEVETVGTYGFAYSQNLTEVILPKAETIGGYAFSGCSKLASVDLPQVKSIGDYAFQSCVIKDLSMPSLETINSNSLAYCSKLETIHFPSLKTIGGSAFQYDQMLKKLILPEGLTRIGEKAFYYCTKIEYVLIPSTIDRVDSQAFQQNIALKEVVFLGKPEGYLSNLAFTNCTSLLDIYVPWNYGEVRNAPWGATNAAIHYADENWMEDLDEIMAAWEVE